MLLNSSPSSPAQMRSNRMRVDREVALGDRGQTLAETGH
jgi:hypothetical protein